MGTIALGVEDLLGELGGESEQEKRDLDIERGPSVDEMIEGFEATFQAPWQDLKDADKLYVRCEEHIPTKYNARDVELFSLLISQYESRRNSDWHGMYLSVLVNHCPDKEVTLITRLSEKALWAVGYQNDGHTIMVQGNVGTALGSGMSDGKIVVQGDAENYVGLDMSGGEIVIEGNAKGNLGCKMSGGVIRVEGQYGDIASCIPCGNIYHKGIQIVREGIVLRAQMTSLWKPCSEW